MIDSLLPIFEYSSALSFFAQAEPEAIPLVPLISRVLHILGAVILGGGVFFLRSVLSSNCSEPWFQQRRATWARWVGVATFLLLASGIYNFLVINGQAQADGGKLPANYHMLFGTKVLLGLVVMFVAAILAGKTNAADKFREKSSLWLNVAWFSVMAILVLAAILRYLH